MGNEQTAERLTHAKYFVLNFTQTRMHWRRKTTRLPNTSHRIASSDCTRVYGTKMSETKREFCSAFRRLFGFSRWQWRSTVIIVIKDRNAYDVYWRPIVDKFCLSIRCVDTFTLRWRSDDMCCIIGSRTMAVIVVTACAHVISTTATHTRTRAEQWADILSWFSRRPTFLPWKYTTNKLKMKKKAGSSGNSGSSRLA